MDFSKENLIAAEKADMAYPQWYSRLPDERKADFFKGGFDFVTEKIRRDVQNENPFATEPDILLRFIELTQKEEYNDDVFAFIREQMSLRSEKAWQQRFKAMKKTLGWTYEDMAVYMDAENGASVKASVNRRLPAFAKLAVCIFEQLIHEKNSR